MGPPPTISVAIPLHESRRFIEVVAANIEAIERDDVEILLSDRTGLDDALEHLAARFAGDPRVTTLHDLDGADWVEHCNSLLRRARGASFCWMPHDDDFPPGWLDTLAGRLSERPDAVIAFGRVAAIEPDGTPMPLAVKHPRAEPADRLSSVSAAVDLLVNGGVAFRGLFRRAPVVEHGCFIPRTRDGVHADRAWVFAVAMLGPMVFVPEAVCRKRYYDASTHASWSTSGRAHRVSLASTLAWSALTGAGSLRERAVALAAVTDYTVRPLLRTTTERRTRHSGRSQDRTA
jgi:hypothetical protein